MHMAGRVAKQVAMLVNGAALNGQVVAPERHKRGFQPRRAIHDREFGPLKAAGVEIGEKLRPCRFALTARSAGD